MIIDFDNVERKIHADLFLAANKIVTYELSCILTQMIIISIPIQLSA